MNIYSKVKFPQLRQMLMFSFKNLSDKAYQLREWTSGTAKHKFWDYFSEDLMCIEDASLDRTPDDKIGFTVLSHEECEIVQPLYKAIDDICDKIGPNQPDSAYINSPLWDRVVETSQKALAVFMKNEEEARKLNPVPWKGEDDWGAA